MYIHISGWHTIHLGALCSLTIARRCMWHSGQRCHRFWWRCTCFFAPPACLWILCSAILASKAAVCFDVHQPLPGVLLSQSLPVDAQHTQHHACSLLGLQREHSRLVFAFPLTWHAKTIFWPFWPYSMQGAGRNVLAVLDLFASP